MRAACRRLGRLLLIGAWATVSIAAARAADRPIVVRAAAPQGQAYQFAIELAQVLDSAPKDRIVLSVATSGGSGENAPEAATMRGAGIVIAMPGAVRPAAGRFRALFPLPFLAMHWVVRADSGVDSLAGLAGRHFIPGAGLSAVETAQALDLIRLAKPIDSIAAAHHTPSLTDARAIGFAEAAAFPAPDILALARKIKLRLLALPKKDLARMLERDGALVAIVIPGGVYPGITGDVTTVAMPLGAYATRRMSQAEAYRLTQAFWANRRALEARDPRWAAVAPQALFALGAAPAAGALRYYRKAGIPLSPARR